MLPQNELSDPFLSLPAEVLQYILQILAASHDMVASYKELTLVSKVFAQNTRYVFNNIAVAILAEQYGVAVENEVPMKTYSRVKQKAELIARENFGELECTILLSNAIKEGLREDVDLLFHLCNLQWEFSNYLEIRGAICHGYLDLPLYLLNQKGVLRVNELDNALAFAIIQGDRECVSNMLVTNLNTHLPLFKLWDTTPLMYACILGYVEIVEILLKYIPKQYIDVIGYDTKSALMYACETLDRKQSYPIKHNVRVDYVGCIKLLLKHGANINLQRHKDLVSTALMLAAQAGHEDRVEELLKAKDIDVNMRQKDRDFYFHIGSPSALIAAVNSNNSVIVKMLIDAGVNIDEIYICNYRISRTALALAAERGAKECVAVLLQAGASKRLALDCLKWPELAWQTVFADEKTFREFVKNNQFTQAELELAMQVAVKRDCPDAIEVLVNHASANVNHIYPHNRTLVQLAAELGRANCLKVLIRFNADVNVVEDNLQGGRDALQKAHFYNHYECILILLEVTALSPENAKLLLRHLKTAPSVVHNTLKSYRHAEQHHTLFKTHVLKISQQQPEPSAARQFLI